MCRNRAKIVALLLAIFLIFGCAGKRDFTKGVSEEDKKLFSSNKDKKLFIYKHIVIITQNGFYPYIKSEYDTKVASYIDRKKFNLKKFMNDVNKYNLKSLRIKLLTLKKKYPSVSLLKATKTEIETLFSANISQYEIDKILVRCTPSYLYKVINPTKELKQIALDGKKANCTGNWHDDISSCLSQSDEVALIHANEEAKRRMNSRPSSYSSSGGSSSSSSSSSNSNYIPGRGYYRPGLGHGYSSQY